jgi:hypothetical protein
MNQITLALGVRQIWKGHEFGLGFSALPGQLTRRFNVMIHSKYSAVIASIAVPLGVACSSPDNAASDAQTQPAAGDFVTPGMDVSGEGMGDGTDDAAATDDDTAATDTASPDGDLAVVPPEGAGGVDGPLIVEQAGDEVSKEEEGKDCAAANVGTSLVRVVLAFTFDVSASMGSHFAPYYSRELKWEPVVSATKAFFADAASAGISATMTFFPDETASLVGGDAATTDDTTTMDDDMADTMFGGGQFGGGGGFQGGGAMCENASYETPDVPLTPLPSDAFATAIDAVTPAGDDDWRLGTPTGPALQGTVDAIRNMQESDPNAKYVIVLVTDGEPAFCPNTGGDPIEPVADIASGVADEIPTYVIGLGNPATDEEPDPPDDGLSNLHVVAEAGGTSMAYIIDTNDPTSTAQSFREVIDTIRENSFSCSLEIPTPPEGEVFDPTKVNVQYNNALGTTEFVNDPTCAADFGWHYDDPDNPTVIQMCDKVCEDIKADYENEGELAVEFGCVSRVPTAN